MAHILVTGASGFIGLVLSRALAANNDNVTASLCEITEWSTLIEIIKYDPPDAILHCAAIVGVIASVQTPYCTMQVVIGRAILDHCSGGEVLSRAA